MVNLFKSDENEEKVFGVALEIDEERSNEIMAKLDHREKGGYSQHIVQFFPSDETEFTAKETETGIECVVYVGDQSHPQFAGPAPIEEIAKTMTCLTILLRSVWE